MIEIKLSQGAKPGHGGVLPGAKVSREIAEIRGVATGEDCISPASHGAFSTPVEMMAFIGRLRELSRRQAGRLQALHRPSLGIPGDLQGDGRDRHLSRFHRRRRQGGRHRRGAARIHRSSRHAAARGARFVRNALIGIGARDRIRIGCARQDRDRLRHGRGFRARRRLVQFGARLHVRARLHPIAELPHRPLPDGRRDAGSDPQPRAGRGGQDRAGAQFSPLHAARARRNHGRRGPRTSQSIPAPNISRAASRCAKC